MEILNAFLTVLSGLFLRLALPIVVTAGMIAVLRRMDARWQLEAQQVSALPIEKTKCWEIKNCTPEQRAACTVRFAEAPCWQERRLSNGYLAEECLDCEVFEQAPIPQHVANV